MISGLCQKGTPGFFREKRLVKKAWGFTKLYDYVPLRQKAEARQCVHALFGGGNGPYYRAHHGEIMLSPEKQEEIWKVLAKFCSIEGVKFDHYVIDLDLPSTNQLLLFFL